MINCAVLTISDTRTLETDTSGRTLEQLVTSFGATVAARLLETDDRSRIAAALIDLCDREDVNLVITTGGTGLSPRDNTPEATRDVIEREAIGIAEAIRRETSGTTATAMLSRATAGTRSGTLIINLPGSTKAVEECFEVLRPVLKHAVAQVVGMSDHKK